MTVKLYDLLGREVATLVDRKEAPGTYAVPWGTGNFASGVYFYRMESEGFVAVKKLLLLK